MMKNELGELGEELGGLIAPAIRRQTTAMRELVEVAREIPEPVKAGGVAFASLESIVLGLTAIMPGPLKGAVAGYGSIAAAVTGLGIAVYGANPGVQALNKALDEQAEIDERINRASRAHTQATITRAMGAGGERKTPEEQQKDLQKAADDAQAKLEDSNKTVAQAQKSVDEYAASWNAATGYMSKSFYTVGIGTEAFKGLMANLEEQSKWNKRAREALDGIKAALKGVEANVISNDQALKNMNSDLEATIKYAGMTAQEIERMKHAAGTPELLKMNEELERGAEIAKRWGTAVLGIRQMGLELEHNREVLEKFGMQNAQKNMAEMGIVLKDSANAMAVFGKSISPATQKLQELTVELEQIQKMPPDLLKKMVAQGKMTPFHVEELKKAIAETRKAVDVEDRKRFTEEAIRLTSEFGTPAEQMREKLAKLNLAWRSNELSIYAYNRALAKYQEEATGPIAIFQPPPLVGTAEYFRLIDTEMAKWRQQRPELFGGFEGFEGKIAPAGPAPEMKDMDKLLQQQQQQMELQKELGGAPKEKPLGEGAIAPGVMAESIEEKQLVVLGQIEKNTRRGVIGKGISGEAGTLFGQKPQPAFPTGMEPKPPKPVPPEMIRMPNPQATTAAEFHPLGLGMAVGQEPESRLAFTAHEESIAASKRFVQDIDAAIAKRQNALDELDEADYHFSRNMRKIEETFKAETARAGKLPEEVPEEGPAELARAEYEKHAKAFPSMPKDFGAAWSGEDINLGKLPDDALLDLKLPESIRKAMSFLPGKLPRLDPEDNPKNWKMPKMDPEDNPKNWEMPRIAEEDNPKNWEMPRYRSEDDPHAWAMRTQEEKDAITMDDESKEFFRGMAESLNSIDDKTKESDVKVSTADFAGG
jgi:hypothetical protein